jgi:hypothetical protein
MADPTKSVKCVRDWRDFPADYYRLPRDGRKWRVQAQNRMRLADYLSTFANGDGTSITVGIERICSKFDPIDRATIFRWLDDLRELQALAPKSGLTSRHGTAVREMTFDAFVARYETQTEAETEATLRSLEDFEKSQVRNQEVAGSPVKKSQVHSKKSQVHREYATQPTLTVSPTKTPTDKNQTVGGGEVLFSSKEQPVTLG